MKKSILSLILAVLLCQVILAQPRIKQRDIVGLNDSLRSKYTKTQADNRYLKLTDYSPGSNQLQADWDATSGVQQILNKPVVPQNTNQLINGSGFITGSDSRLSDARPSSDVYSWAKAAVKPAYTYSEVGAAPLSHTQGQSTITALPDSLTAKYTRTQADNRYFKTVDSEQATQYFYTKAQVMQKIDSVKQTILDYINANYIAP